MRSSSSHLSVTILPLFIIMMSALMSCRATSPISSATKSAPASSDEPVATEKNDPNLGVLRWVVATRASSAGPDSVTGWDLVLKTDSEVWCEARCSKFELVEITDGDTSELGVKKTTIPGNTTPGMLDVKKQAAGSRAPAAKMRLLNVGVKGQSIVLEDVVTKDRPNFYAVPMKISSRSIGEKSVLKGEFADKVVELRLEKSATLPQVVSRSAAPVEAFVMGSLIEGQDADGSPIQIFTAFKVLPQTED